MTGVKKVSARDIKQLFYNDHLEVDREIRNLKSAIINLRRGGKSSLGRKLSHTKDALSNLEKRLIEHMLMEEETMFPFLRRIFPRYGALIRFLCDEHKSLKRYMKEIQRPLSGSSVKRYSMEKIGEAARTLREYGFCLIYLLKGHAQAENASVYRTIGLELQPDERRKLFGLIQRYQLTSLQRE